jgi:hypothetical protein
MGPERARDHEPDDRVTGAVAGANTRFCPGQRESCNDILAQLDLVIPDLREGRECHPEREDRPRLTGQNPTLALGSTRERRRRPSRSPTQPHSVTDAVAGHRGCRRRRLGVAVAISRPGECPQR